MRKGCPLRVMSALLLGLGLFVPSDARMSERGTLAIYFREAKIGYEEYVWTEDAEGYELSVTGRMSGPMTLEIERLRLRMDRDFIARTFFFKGTVNGVPQEIESTLREGAVTNRIKVAGQVMDSTASVRRDALLLPNPIFSPYLVVAKKFGCGLQAPAEIAAYIIPQVEVAGRVEPKAGSPCALVLTLGGVEIALAADEEGRLTSLLIPGQGIRVAVEETF
ncbi:MAG: hypothetical protein JW747_04910 [Candidatus Aminicenantes bacterium]|nr:hypothetical protein [Candidatus Aminicenantes bacterium]